MEGRQATTCSGRRQTPGAGAEEPRPNFGGHSLSQASSTHFDCVSPVAADDTEGPTISHSVSVQIAHVFHNCDTPHPGPNRATRSLCWSSLHSVRLTMSLPSSREIELETLLRQRDAQVLELTVRIFHIAYEYRSRKLKMCNRTKSPISASIYLPNQDRRLRTRYHYLLL